MIYLKNCCICSTGTIRKVNIMILGIVRRHYCKNPLILRDKNYFYLFIKHESLMCLDSRFAGRLYISINHFA